MPQSSIAITYKILDEGKGFKLLTADAEGLVFYQETEAGYKSCLAMITKGQSVEVKCMERENTDKPYLTGKFVITSLERTDAAQDDATYSISLENDGEVTFDETAITETPETAGA